MIVGLSYGEQGLDIEVPGGAVVVYPNEAAAAMSVRGTRL